MIFSRELVKLWKQINYFDSSNSNKLTKILIKIPNFNQAPPASSTDPI